MPARRIPALPAGTLRSAPPQTRARGINRIISRREQLMAEAARLGDHGAPARFTEKVQQLLTRWWSPASWQGREELLKTAEWLISLEKIGGTELCPPSNFISDVRARSS